MNLCERKEDEKKRKEELWSWVIIRKMKILLTERNHGKERLGKRGKTCKTTMAPRLL